MSEPEHDRPTRAGADRRVMDAWVLAALKRAVAEPEAQAQLQPNGTDDALPALARHLQDMHAVVLIETALPYAEQIIALLVQDEEQTRRWNIVEPQPIDTDGSHFETPHFDADSLLVLSFREGIGFSDESELAHAIDTIDNPVLIGCERRGDVPDRLARQADLVLRLPENDVAVFTEVFATLFGPVEPMPGIEATWPRFVLPTDLQPPLRQGYEADEALAYVADRVQARLAALAPESAPRLEDLHGIGSAREIAADLVREIRLAGQGELPWDAVDRGMLMVGPPGTGKTTLARAIAREGGIRFLSASAAEWQVGASLGEHLGRIRASFAEARRYAPSILFIDEIDSLGNRERLENPVRSYQTNVINTVLEELDGFGGREQVVVIAATNHAGNVDPALRRSGRLDQVVEIPYPSIPALERIYEFHLKPFRDRGRVGNDLDLASIAGMSFGLTGADVEFIVKGAARRARRRRNAISQADLVAEITDKPRQESRQLPIDAATLQRLATHEAGHALARLLGPGRGEDIAYVSIAPRADGRIGYLAEIDLQRDSMTRDAFLHEIRLCLAGRAAEESLYPDEGPSDLAANHGAASDLAQATRIATHLRGLSGLDPEGDLFWWNVLPGGAGRFLGDEVEALLASVYHETLEMMNRHADTLRGIRDLLLERQEISGAELRAQFLPRMC